MYTAHFGLAAEPFSLSPDPGFLYRSPQHAEALAALHLALRSRRGLTTLIGEVGTGKTTLLYTLLTELGPTVHTAYLANTSLTFDELLRRALADFGVPCPGAGRVDLLDALEGFLRRCDQAGAIVALVIDEAQNLDAETFEQLRLLTNFETFAHKLLQIVLVGQPELGDVLRRPALRQVDERIAYRCHIGPLTRRECVRYLTARLERAGGSLALFSRPARALMIRASRGLPRRLNVLGHTALLFAFGRGAPRVSWRVMREALRVRTARAARVLGGPTPRWQRAAWAAALAVVAAGGVAAGVVRLSAPQPAVPAAAVAVADPASAPASVAPPDAPLDLAAPKASIAPDTALPAPSSMPAAAQPPAFVEVQPGMTLRDIALQYYGNAGRATLRRIRSANPALHDPNRIAAGDVLRLPGGLARERLSKGANG
jgi:general secretion pathway protein A